MKKFILLALIMSTQVLASDADCLAPGSLVLPPEVDLIRGVISQQRHDFQRRNMSFDGYRLGLNIESNFKIPLVGSQNYFGRIYFRPGSRELRYRDEDIARRRYREESRNEGTFYTTGLDVASLNRPDGYEVASGVRVYGHNFNTNTGGRLTLSIKPPGDDRMNIPFQVTIVNNRPVSSITVGGRRIVFDTLKINATNGSILRGLDNIQFFAGGRAVHTLTN